MMMKEEFYFINNKTFEQINIKKKLLEIKSKNVNRKLEVTINL